MKTDNMDYKYIIDDILDKGYNKKKILNDILSGDFKIIDGDREIYIFDDIIIKVPSNKRSIKSIVENIVSKNTNYTFLCPVLCYYRGCIVMKKLETKYFNSSITNKRESLMNAILDKYCSELNDLCENYNLSLENIMCFDNWVYDEKYDSFKCINYGFINE